MKMVMAIVQRDETAHVMEALIAAGHTATFNESRGGVLRQASNTLFIATQADRLQEVLDIIRENCRSSVSMDSTQADEAASPLSTHSWAQVGGAVVIVWSIDQFDVY
ncbi:MAG: cyclic-di-AMP receptor [Anaerolineae bacterium]|nr:cyclic-di-AMP receptor [Anaerolineae bacterium]